MIGNLANFCRLENCPDDHAQQEDHVQAEVEFNIQASLSGFISGMKKQAIEFWPRFKTDRHVHLITQPWWESIFLPLP